jgi:hypothetical protein
MNNIECIYNLKGLCCNSLAPIPCHSKCLGVANCDVVETKSDVKDNPGLSELIEAIELTKTYTKD